MYIAHIYNRHLHDRQIMDVYIYILVLYMFCRNIIRYIDTYTSRWGGCVVKYPDGKGMTT